MASGYDHPLVTTVTALANAAVSSAADIFEIVSPVPGKTGKILGVSLVTSTATTTAAATINIGTQATADAYGVIDVPITSINSAVPVTLAQLEAMSLLPADTVITVSGGGEAAAGALDIVMTIGWF